MTRSGKKLVKYNVCNDLISPDVATGPSSAFILNLDRRLRSINNFEQTPVY